jgi:hypothetical protein
MALPLHVRNTHPEYVEGCEGCKIANLAFGFHRYPAGRAEFKGATINERRERIISEAAKNGNRVEPINTSANAWAPTKV